MRRELMEGKHSRKTTRDARCMLNLIGEWRTAVELKTVNVLSDGDSFGKRGEHSLGCQILYNEGELHDIAAIMHDAMIFYRHPRAHGQGSANFCQCHLYLRMPARYFRGKIAARRRRYVVEGFRLWRFAYDEILSEVTKCRLPKGMGVRRIKQDVLMPALDRDDTADVFKPSWKAGVYFRCVCQKGLKD